MANLGGNYYKLDDKHNVIECTRDEYITLFGDDKNRRVAKTTIGNVEVSTVFLGLDHGFSQHDVPIVFETMVFNGPFDGDMERYATWQQAVDGHVAMVNKVMQENPHG
jgi:hypothetical protein